MSPVKTRLTDAELMALPDDGHKYEYVDGELKDVPTEFDHDLICIRLIAAMYPFTVGQGYCSSGQAGFRMASSNLRVPDVSFTRKERFPDGKPVKGFVEFAADFCVEVISPSEERADMERKVREYFASGAQLVWHVFSEAQTVRAFTSPDTSQTYDTQDTLTLGDLLPGFKIAVADLFAVE